MPANSDGFEKSKSIRHLLMPLSRCGLIRSFQQLSMIVTAQTLSLSIVLVATCGCHPFGTRATLSDQDDWEAPARNAYSMPRQFQSQYSTRNKASDSTQTSANKESSSNPTEKPNNTSTDARSPTAKPSDSQAANASEQPKPGPTNDKQLSNTTTNKPISHNSTATPEPTVQVAEAIAETNDVDLDLQTAIAALPPNLQEIFRNQLLATVGSVPSQQSNEQMASINSGSSAPDTDQVSPNAIAAATPTDQPRNSIKLSLSDRNQSQPASEQLIAKSTTNDTAPTAEARHPANVTSTTLTSTTPAGSTSPIAMEYNEQVSATNSNNLNPAPAAVQTASASVAVERSLTWDQSLSQAESALTEELENGSTMDDKLRFKYELALRLIRLANNNVEEALEPIEGMQQSEQEYFRYQLQALFDSTNPEASPVASRRWALVMENQRKANQHLASISNLEIRNAAFCTDVQGYGSVTPFQSKLFKPDQDVLLYCELENVTADEIRNGFETQLQGSYEIVDSRGNRIADQLLPMEKEICSNYRRDYFVVYRIFMPLQIAPGNYEMRVTIEDMKGKKFGQTSLEFQIQK